MGVSEAASAECIQHRHPPGAQDRTSTAGSKGGNIIGTDKIVRSSSQQLLHLIETSLADDKAIDVAIIDLTGKTAFADAMVIATGEPRLPATRRSQSRPGLLAKPGFFVVLHVPLRRFAETRSEKGYSADITAPHVVGQMVGV